MKFFSYSPLIVNFGDVGKRGKERKFWGRKSRFKIMGMGKNIKLQGTLYTPEMIFPPFQAPQGTFRTRTISSERDSTFVERPTITLCHISKKAKFGLRFYRISLAFVKKNLFLRALLNLWFCVFSFATPVEQESGNKVFQILSRDISKDASGKISQTVIQKKL